MDVWKIYHKDGTIVKDANGNEIDIRSLEYLDSWMGECYLTVTFKHETPIVFSMGKTRRQELILVGTVLSIAA